MAAANILVHVTHIDDSIRGRQGPCVYFWGITHDRSVCLLMQNYIESIRHELENRPPPLNLNVLDQVCCVMINHQWYRARVPLPKLSQTGTLDVICIDSGDTFAVPLAYVRTLDIPASAAEHIREWPPLATKFILADMVAPRGPGTQTHWSEPAIRFLKANVENRTWKAATLGMYGEHQGVRLFDPNNQLLATTMIQLGLGLAAQTYKEALSMTQTTDEKPAFMKPAFSATSAQIINTLPPSFAIPATYREHSPTFTKEDVGSPKQSSIPPRAFVTNDIPSKGRHDVVLTHIADGPHKFYLHLKSEANDLLMLRRKLDSIVAPHPFRGVPKPGTSCIAVSPSDKLCHRGLITALNDCNPQPTCSVYFVDIGTQEPVSLEYICEIPDDVLVPRLFACRVSLFGVEEVANLVGLNELFTALVKSAPYLQVEVVENDESKQKVSLYDNTGRSIRDVLVSILVNLSMPTSAPAAPSTSPTNLNKAACVTEVPSINLDPEETLYVFLAQEPGCFFGQLEKLPVQDLDDVTAELMRAYSSDPNPVLLYADAKSHLGHFGVVQWDEDKSFYRIRVTQELVNDAQVRFIDYGNCLQIPRCKIFAPLDDLTCFRHPPFGINCKIDGHVMLSTSEWSELILEKQIKVKIVSCVGEIYSVTLSDDPCNNDIAKVVSKVPPISNAVIVPKPVENVSDQNAKTNVDRIKRNDNFNADKSHYVHPNAKDTNWRTNGTEDVKQSAEPRSNKDSNWRSSNPVQEVIRAPRGPPPSTGHEETKGPQGFKRSGSLEKSPPLINPAIVTPSSVVNITNPPLPVVNITNPPPPVVNIKNPPPPVVNMTNPPPVVKPDMPNQPTIPSVQKQYTYAIQALPAANSQVQVACVVDPTNFYVQLSKDSTILTDLIEKFNKVYSDELKPIIQDVKPGSACAVQYLQDNGWYRGQVLELNDLQLPTILFVDYGNMQQSSVKQLKAIDEEFAQLPPQAFLCRLSGVGNSRVWTDEEKKTFRACTMNGSILTATFGDRDGEGKFPVRLVDGIKVINEAYGAPCSTSVPPPSTGYSYLPFPQAPIEVSIAWYYNPGRIFTSPVDLSEYQNELDELEEFYSSLSPDELVEEQPSVGLPCVARFTEDGRYYRSKIVSIASKVAKVLFVDYGNEQDTPISQLKRMVPRFMKCPQLIWHSRLKGVKKISSGAVNADPQKHITTCFSTGNLLSALFHSSCPGGNNGVFEVEFNAPEIGDVADYLIKNRVLDRISLDAPIPLAAQNLNFSPDQIISTTAVAPYALSPAEFWIQPQPDSVYTIMDRIDQLAVDPTFRIKKNFTASVGKPCLAFFADDGRWYRALVESVDGESVKVYYIDYGNCCMVNTKDLRDLPDELAIQPALAFKCRLDGVNSFSETTTDEFVSSVTELDAFTVKYINVVDGVLNVGLYDPEGTYINEKFLTEPSIPEVSVMTGAVENVMHAPNSIDQEHLIQSIPSVFSQSDVGADATAEQLDTISEEQSKRSETNLVKVYITHSSSPNQFWFQLRERDAKLAEMSDQMTEMFNANMDSFRIPKNPAIDEIYVTTHPVYDGWYRSQIKAVSGDTCEVYFVDYGDTHTVHTVNIFSLPQQFADIPAMAIEGSLNIECSPEVVEKFNAFCDDPDKTHWIVFGPTVNGIQLIKYLYIDVDDILDLLATELAAVAEEPDTAGCSTMPYAEVVSVSDALLDQSSRIIDDSSVFYTEEDSTCTPSTTAEDDASKIISSTGDSSLFTPCEELSSICPSAANVTVETPAEPTIEDHLLLPLMDLNFAPGQKMSTYALASHIECATEIWIQLDPNAVNSLMDEISKEKNLLQLPTDPQIHGHYLAMFNDGLWCRAVVDGYCVGGTQINVTFVDYGNSSSVDVEDLRVLPTHFAQQPALAVKCALDGTLLNLVSSPTPEQCESIIGQEALSVVFTKQTSEHVYVRLFDSLDSDLNEKLGLPESFKTQFVATNLLEFNVFDDVEMPSPMSRTADPVFSETFDEDRTQPLEVVVVRGVAEGPMVAIPSVVEKSENEEMETVNVMEVAMIETDFFKSFSDSVNSFSQEAMKESIAELEEIHPLKHLTIIEEEVVVADAIDVAAEMDDGNLTKDLNVSEGKSLMADDVGVLFSHSVDVPSMEFSSLNTNQFEDLHLTLSSEHEQVMETNAEALEFKEKPLQSPKKIVDALYDERVVMQIKSEMMHREGEVAQGSVYISHIVSPGDFWIQFSDDEQSIGDMDQQLVEMGVELNSKYALSGPPVVGRRYACKHPEFGYWYRAMLLRLDEDRAEVRFMDYGDKQVLPIDCIRQLSPILQYLPNMAHNCKLAAVQLDCWPENATEVMKTLCQPEYVCRAVFKEETSRVLEVVSLSIGSIDVVEAVLSNLESRQTIPPIFSPPQSLTGGPQVDATMVFFPVETTTSGQELNEDKSRQTVD